MRQVHMATMYIWPIISINPIEINSCTNKNQKKVKLRNDAIQRKIKINRNELEIRGCPTINNETVEGI